MIDPEADSGSEEAQDSVNTSKNKKVFMPYQFSKAKRTLTKVITAFFNELKTEYLRHGGKIFLDENELQPLISSLHHYVGVRHFKKAIKFQTDIRNGDLGSKKVKQYRSGAFGYISEAGRILQYGSDGRVSPINIEKEADLVLPDAATPVPFGSDIFLLDCCDFSLGVNSFLPREQSYKVSKSNRITPLQGGPILKRAKCAIVRAKKYIYLLGGFITNNKILTRRCERYDPDNDQSQEITPLNYLHSCPTATYLANRIWLFSRDQIEVYEEATGDWSMRTIPFAAQFLPFQFVHPLNETEIIVFGGMCLNRKSMNLGVYSTQHNLFDNYGQLLPQGICSQRMWSPWLAGDHLIAISNVQASVYPQVSFKSNTVQVISIGSSSVSLSLVH